MVLASQPSETSNVDDWSLKRSKTANMDSAFGKKKKKEIKAKATVLFDKSLKIHNHCQSQKIP